MYHSTDQLQLFQQRLPRKPYCTNDPGTGLRIAHAKNALKARYIQHNGPTHKFWLVYDVDRPDTLNDWSDRGAPAPNIAVINPENRHGHLIYGLEIPVRTAFDGRMEPIRYAGAVDCALAHKLDADLGYAGVVCKNPLHEHWESHVWEDQLYTLDLLADYLDLSKYGNKARNLPDYGLGRNCTLFQRLSRWSYKAIRQGWPEYDQWLMATRQRALTYNDFPEPLPVSEVMHTAKSVAGWTHKNFSATGFSEWQAEQGRKGGLKKGKALRDQMLPQVQELLRQGFTKADIARELGQSKVTIGNWVKRVESQS